MCYCYPMSFCWLEYLTVSSLPLAFHHIPLFLHVASGESSSHRVVVASNQCEQLANYQTLSPH